MAIYHLHAKIISRAPGRSVVAAAAYRSGEKLYDDRSDQAHDYRRKSDVLHTEVRTPRSAPEWAKDRQTLWATVEATEKRKDAQLAREIEVSLPREMPFDEQRQLVQEFVQSECVDRGMIADICLHNPASSDQKSNPHAHILLTLRRITPEGFGKKERGWNDKHLLEHWREAWARHTNRALARSGQATTIDHRSYAAQGLQRQPEPKLGAARLLWQRGEPTPRYDQWLKARPQNAIEAQTDNLRPLGTPTPTEITQSLSEALRGDSRASRLDMAG